VKPVRLCTPADKNDEGTTNPSAHLLCYQAKAAKGEAKHEVRAGLYVADQFERRQVDTVKEQEVCVPSTKTAGTGE
jgi:hypothetical protein